MQKSSPASAGPESSVPQRFTIWKGLAGIGGRAIFDRCLIAY